MSAALLVAALTLACAAHCVPVHAPDRDTEARWLAYSRLRAVRARLRWAAAVLLLLGWLASVLGTPIAIDRDLAQARWDAACAGAAARWDC